MTILGYTPKNRPIIGGAERIDPVDRVLRVVGHRTEDITLTPAGTDVSAGEGAFYRVGLIDRKAVGRYMIERQGAASASADPLGTLSWVLFDIREQAAGVFEALHMGLEVTVTQETEGGNATDDADDTDPADIVSGRSGTNLVAIDDAQLDGANSDTQTTVFIAKAADVVDAAAWGISAVLVLDNLYILDAIAASTRKYRITRVS